MTARLIVIAVASLGWSTFAGAGGPNPVAAANSAPSRPADMVLASAETVHASEQAQPQAQTPAPPAKRVRVARVTTCRCGDTTAQTPEE